MSGVSGVLEGGSAGVSGGAGVSCGASVGVGVACGVDAAEGVLVGVGVEAGAHKRKSVTGFLTFLLTCRKPTRQNRYFELK